MTQSTSSLLDSFHQWLASLQTTTSIIRFVTAEYRKPSNSNLFSGYEVEDLHQEFLLFILDTFLTPAKLTAETVPLLRTAQYPRIIQLAWNKFLWQCRETARSKRHNPRGYLYRRLRETIQQAKKRFTVSRSQQGYPLYIPAGHAVQQAHPFCLPDNEQINGYGLWPAPPPAEGKIPEKYLFERDWLLDTADFFWLLVVQRTAGPLTVPIRELSRYIADHHPWLNIPQRYEKEGSDITQHLRAQERSPEKQLLYNSALHSVAQLAKQLVATWPIEQQQVFALRFADPPVTGKAITRNLGFTSQSRAYGLEQKAKESITQFTRSWPGIPLSELPEEVAVIFIEEIKRLCKKSLS
ncbi:hypothetical protein [Desulfobulbus oligotrophicus]|jgi:hypothetical protein|uniref:Uncharacterized protein n=1 Tax=Desulfobulbus oligotrophicus TaxID=1909699 RepID=A0A7T5VET3_9BACT|nr:hypothetical protein [Desulfobulbus oligotrophicus]MDY0389775.1 hypothetical protein [Desulfobulbus oligotrophicus]QQG66584.1 hypothetical protein HP555_12245 [Desulfobulbus oligotrophicus]